jgi:hypothetical protein
MTFKSSALVVHRKAGYSSAESSFVNFPNREEADAVTHILGSRSTVPNQASATARALESDCVSRLARFFPDATPVRIPIRLSRAHENSDDHAHGNGGASRHSWHALQDTVIEFGTPHEVLFVIAQPVEFADRVLIESRDGSLSAEASVVAVQYYAERTVVGARFLQPVPNWIVKS